MYEFSISVTQQDHSEHLILEHYSRFCYYSDKLNDIPEITTNVHKSEEILITMYTFTSTRIYQLCHAIQRKYRYVQMLIHSDYASN